MEITPDDFEDLRAQAMAQKLLLNAVLIALVDKKTLAKSDVTVLIEASIASLDRYADLFLARVASHIEEFHAGIGGR